MARMKWSIALRLGALLASFSVFAAILAGYYTFDSSRERLQGRAERSLLATTQVLARHMQAGFGTVARDTAFLADAAKSKRTSVKAFLQFLLLGSGQLRLTSATRLVLQALDTVLVVPARPILNGSPFGGGNVHNLRTTQGFSC